MSARDTSVERGRSRARLTKHRVPSSAVTVTSSEEFPIDGRRWAIVQFGADETPPETVGVSGAASRVGKV